VRAADAEPLDRWLPYVPWHNERLRLLEAVGLVGRAQRSFSHCSRSCRATRRTRREAAARRPAARRAESGCERPRRRCRSRSLPSSRTCSLAKGRVWSCRAAGRMSSNSAQTSSRRCANRRSIRRTAVVDGLAALLQRARSSSRARQRPLQLAQALGTPTVGIFWFVNLLISGPLTSHRNRCAASLMRRAGLRRDNLKSRCEHDPSFVADVSTEEVTELALDLWRQEESASSASSFPQYFAEPAVNGAQTGRCSVGRAAPSATFRMHGNDHRRQFQGAAMCATPVSLQTRSRASPSSAASAPPRSARRVDRRRAHYLRTAAVKSVSNCEPVSTSASVRFVQPVADRGEVLRRPASGFGARAPRADRCSDPGARRWQSRCRAARIVGRGQRKFR